MRRRKTQFVLLSYHKSTLAALLRRRRESGAGILPWSAVHRLSVQLLEAAQHLFAHGVVHLDVKPDNVLMDDDDDVDAAAAVLADLGCSMKCRAESWEVPVSIITVRGRGYFLLLRRWRIGRRVMMAPSSALTSPSMSSLIRTATSSTGRRKCLPRRGGC